AEDDREQRIWHVWRSESSAPASERVSPRERRAIPSSHPALALEEAQQEHAGNQQAAESQHEERPRRGDAFRHQPAEVHAEEPGYERERQKHRADDRELLHYLVLAVADSRQVEVGSAAEQVA